MAVDFDAIKVVIDQIDAKINETKVLIDEAAGATWISPSLGLRNYSAADLAASVDDSLIKSYVSWDASQNHQFDDAAVCGQCKTGQKRPPGRGGASRLRSP